MASWLDMLNPFSGAELTDAQQASRMGMYQGLLNMGAQMMDAGRPRLVMQEGFGPGLLGGLGRGAAAFGQGMAEGRRNYMQQGLLDQQSRRSAAYSEAFGEKPDDQISPQARALRGAVPASMRGLLGGMAPDAGMQMIGGLVTRENDPRRNMMAVGNTVVRIGPDGNATPVYQAPLAPNQRFHFGPQGEVYDLEQMAGGGRGPATAAAPAAGATAAAPSEGGGDLVARVIAAEAGNQGPEGMAAVAHVIANRARLTGMTPEQVVQQPGAFEGLSRARMMPASVVTPAASVWNAVTGGQAPDPTGGATHFLNPDLQRHMGRQQPAWAPEGQGQRIGAHVFYKRPEDFARPVQNGAPAPAAATPGAQPATAAQPRPPGMIVPPRGPDYTPVPPPEGAPPGAYERNNRTGRTERVGGNPPTINNMGENATAKRMAEAWDTAEAAVQAAGRREVLYQAAEKAAQSFQPGIAANARITVGQLAREMGLRVNGLSDGEVLRQVQRRLELAATPTGQGQITENERVLIRDTVPLLGSSPEGMVKALQMLRALDQYDIQVARIYRENARRNGGQPDPVSVREELAAFARTYQPPDIAKELEPFLTPLNGGGGRLPGAEPPPPPAAPPGGQGWGIRRLN